MEHDGLAIVTDHWRLKAGELCPSRKLGGYVATPAQFFRLALVLKYADETSLVVARRSYFERKVMIIRQDGRALEARRSPGRCHAGQSENEKAARHSF